METLLEQYTKVVGNEVIDHLRQLSDPLKGVKVLHINSTKEGGGVAEILNRLIDDLEGFLGFLLWTYRSFYFFSSSLFCELG